MTHRFAAVLGLSIMTAVPPATAQVVPAPQATATTPETGGPSYATLARLTLAATVVVDATIRSTARIAPAEAPGLRNGFARFYVTADVAALIRGDGALPSRIGYLADVALDPRGRAPNLRRQRVIVFAHPVAGRPDQIQLITPDAQLAWTPALDARIRDVVRETLDPAAPRAITGIGSAFHVPGTLPGEGETQIFLQTTNGDPVSLLVLRRPGEARRWALALGDIIGEAGGPPRRDTLAWYRLACALPTDLPEASLQAQEPGNAATARDDYRFVRAELGRCDDGRDGQPG